MTIYLFFQTKRQEPHYNNHPNNYNIPSQYRNSIGHNNHYQHPISHSSNPHQSQQYQHGAHQYPNQQAGQSSYPNPHHQPHHLPHHNNVGGIGASHHYRTGRPPLNSYHSTYNGRSNGGSSQPIQLHRSQVGSYQYPYIYNLMHFSNVNWQRQ